MQLIGQPNSTLLTHCRWACFPTYSAAAIVKWISSQKLPGISGVCRDFAHLAITFCRGLNIPARYAAGYLGEFDIPPQPLPMDFSSWFEVYLDHRWYTFDARHNVPRVGRILMTRGRDAVDTALTTAFKPVNLVNFKVWSDQVSEV
jgi:transglutaminase-like putative cysteine protease